MECNITFLPGVIKSLVLVCLPKIIGQNRMIQKFLSSVFNSLVQVYLPKIVGHYKMIQNVPAKCEKNHMYKYVCLRALVKTVLYIKLLSRVFKSLIQACLANSIGQNEMIH